MSCEPCCEDCQFWNGYRFCNLHKEDSEQHDFCKDFKCMCEIERVEQRMEVKITREEIEYAIKVHIFSQTGLRIDEKTDVRFQGAFSGLEDDMIIKSAVIKIEKQPKDFARVLNDRSYEHMSI